MYMFKFLEFYVCNSEMFISYGDFLKIRNVNEWWYSFLFLFYVGC